MLPFAVIQNANSPPGDGRNLLAAFFLFARLGRDAISRRRPICAIRTSRARALFQLNAPYCARARAQLRRYQAAQELRVAPANWVDLVPLANLTHPPGVSFCPTARLPGRPPSIYAWLIPAKCAPAYRCLSRKTPLDWGPSARFLRLTVATTCFTVQPRAGRSPLDPLQARNCARPQSSVRRLFPRATLTPSCLFCGLLFARCGTCYRASTPTNSWSSFTAISARVLRTRRS